MSNDDDLMRMRLGALDSIDALNKDIYDDSDWKMGVLWFSALAPTSRTGHAERHGVVYTTEEARLFYSKNDNPKNCLCSLSPTLVNVKTGEVLQTELVEKMLFAKKTFMKSVLIE
ncbi:hypothetical protein Shal_0324 [Shewanella halifaxensis HAW-EB4]|uniref:Uncharacterized protein n=1 Tax=Shewanella halifaxensis (strain HAW-EB4) TaxID=458817 RepID=B0TPM9_SHEHH|nr:hypothetical protein [Shewanella halifaxensis]ABZ74900.1 hypothetical protein Shal_0324 [Shewanella halifaxensis HAW-EB4]